MKTRTYIVPCAVAAVIAVAAVGLLSNRPPMPRAWSQLRAGMTQGEVEALLEREGEFGLTKMQQMYEDNPVGVRSGWVSEDAPMLGARSTWSLVLYYDGPLSARKDAKLTIATAKFVHPIWLLRGKPRKLVRRGEG